MTIAYFDSSALVKLVVDEVGSDDAAMLWDGADGVLTSRVAHPEVRAALSAAHRARRLGDGAYEQAKAEWARFRAALRMVEFTPQLETDAGELAEQHRLSGVDAIHLASALTLAAAPVILATWDARLLAAGKAAGLGTLPHRL